MFLLLPSLRGGAGPCVRDGPAAGEAWRPLHDSQGQAVEAVEAETASTI